MKGAADLQFGPGVPRERFACMLRRRAGLDAHEFTIERVDTPPTVQGAPSR